MDDSSGSSYSDFEDGVAVDGNASTGIWFDVKEDPIQATAGGSGGTSTPGGSSWSPFDWVKGEISHAYDTALGAATQGVDKYITGNINGAFTTSTQPVSQAVAGTSGNKYSPPPIYTNSSMSPVQTRPAPGSTLAGIPVTYLVVGVVMVLVLFVVARK